MIRPAAPMAPWKVVWALAAWIALLGNLPLWRELHRLGLDPVARGWPLAAALGALLFAALVGLLSVACWRRSLKPAAGLLLLLTAVGSHFMLTYGIVIDAGMATNVLQTDWHEAEALASPALALILLALAGLPGLWLLRTPVAHRAWAGQAVRNVGMLLAMLMLGAVTVMAAFQPLASAMRNHKQLRYQLNPLNSVYALASAAAQPLRRAALPLEPVGRDARVATTGRPPLLLLVLGETGRSGNFGINGYGRPTTPRLEQAGAISWRDAWSCGTSTAVSVPCMFSDRGREGFDGRPRENLLDVLQHAGLAVLWVDNQSGCKGVCARIPSERTSPTDTPSLCHDGECLDAALLRGLDERIARLSAERRARGVVVVLHQMGSHGPDYARRSPPDAKRFLPECASARLQDCAPADVVNAYDNSIRYTDAVLGDAIDWLKARSATHDTALLYVADHGESLGEHNLYLHGLPYAIAPDVQKHVPWITWLSPGFEAHGALASDCLRARVDRHLTHDSYFHAVLGLLQVETTAYRRALDPYAACVLPASVAHWADGK